MPSTVDLENLEENINGAFMGFLARGGVDVDSLEALAKVKHNTFNRALSAVADTLFIADKKQKNNQKSLLPYDDIYILKQLWSIYYNLCCITDNDCTLQGFSDMTGYDRQTLQLWNDDELNPERFLMFKSAKKERQNMIENKLSDHPIGVTALANNSKELGLNWTRNTAQAVGKTAVFIIPGEQTKNALPGSMARGLPEVVTETMQETG